MSEFESKAQIEDLINTTPSHGQTPNLIKRKKKVSNVPLLIMLFVILCVGLIILFSVSNPIGYAEQKDSLYYVKKQLRFTLIGLGMALFLNYVDPIKILFKRYLLMSLLSGGLALGLAAVTLVAGRAYNGARRWFMIGSFQFQPSELVKVLLVISFASYRQFIVNLRQKGKLKASTRRLQVLKDTMFDFIIPITGAIVVDVLILAEPHGSCAMIIAAIVFICALASGINHRSWIVGGAIMLGVAIVFGAGAYAIMPDEQVTRIEEKVLGNFSHVFKRIAIFTADDEELDNEDEGLTRDDTRQVDNAHNALGSGGMWGVGLGNSRSKYNYVSEAQNDYIFSIYIEETGFVGGVILMMMYLVIFFMCLAVCWRAKDVFSRTIATGCTALIFVEVLMNISVELQVIPATGVTLPFVSYGGTAQVTLLIAYGLILSVSRSGTVRPEKKSLKSPVKLFKRGA